jgi:alkanesulfonate monooxygenase SsuD/methylene tetrahydromethanopterin reductase-like flavin-dependent oxidoreductase (luciferase family)
MRFDMRAPSIGAPAAELYAAALEMASWAETRGALAAVVCEHHSSPDGYLPSPLVLATALASRTTNLPIMVAVALLPLYNPIRMAEDMVVIDIISNGRVSYVVAIGYRPEEYALYGVDFHRRGRIADELFDVLLKAKTGEPFEHEGQTVQVTPAPFTAGGPSVAWGGGSVAAARRAGRFGVDFFAQGGPPELPDVYAEAAKAHGHEPGSCFVPPTDLPTCVFVADDLDRAWDEVGPYLMHDVTSYASWNEPDSATASLSFATSVDELRAENRTHRIVTVDDAVALVQSGSLLNLQPLVGGLPPEMAWRYLRTVADEVMPRLS